ncbi:MAG: inorganic phosphate transporter [Calditrichia bacterium]
MIWFFLLGGLFLGWSLGANGAANIFGTAVGTRMVRFKTAAIVASIFVVLGAVISGAGPAHTLNRLGAVNAMAGSFTVALCAAATVAWMTWLKLPVSTSQAVVGGIIGWNFFTGTTTDYTTLFKIISTWVFSPVLAAAFAALIFYIHYSLWKRIHVHLLRLDQFIRISLLLIGAFGAYSLGANNIANVMGVFVRSSPFDNLYIKDVFIISGTQQLFLLGALAIGLGIFTYSQRVMMTVGNELYHLTPNTALIAVLAESLVLFIFASTRLQDLLTSIGLPAIPLVPISSSQAIIGAVVGIGLVKGGKGINYGILGKISLGWLVTPVAAVLLTFLALFFVQNVFEMQVVQP